MGQTKRPIIFRLSEGDDRKIRVLSDRVEARLLADGKRTVTVTVTRTGQFHDPRYGNFDITRDMLLSMVKNFDSGVYGQRIVLDVSHRPQDGAAGYFKRLFLDGNKLRGEVELTEYGLDAIRKRGMIYLSAEFADNYVGNEAPRNEYGPTLLGAALTPRPVVKRLDPIQLAEGALDGAPSLISDRILKILAEEAKTMEKFLEMLRKALAAKKLSEAVVTKMLDAFKKAAEPMATDELRRELMENFEAAGDELAKQLAEGQDAGSITLNIAAPDGGKTLSEDDVRRLLAEQNAAAAEKAKQLAESRDAKVKRFSDAIDAAEGLKALSEDHRKTLLATADLITADMTDEQVDKLAQHQIKLGNDMAVQAKLSGIGWQVHGNPHITLGEDTAAKELQETFDKRLGITDMADSKRFAATGGQLQGENKALAEAVLAEFDQQNARRLHEERKLLAGGDGIVSDVAVPASFERTVIREALYRLVGLQFVDSGTAQFAASTLIPYSYRDTTAANRTSTRIYEGGSVPRAGVKQVADTAYPIPQKIAFEISNELMLLTQGGILDWNALTENQRNASRIIAEDTELMIGNELVGASDEYLAAQVANEAVANGDGAKVTFPLAQFPVVHPRAIYDMQGQQVGNTKNPITVSVAAGAVTEYDGTGTQAAGTYYSLDYNTGMITFVTEAGAASAPANGAPIVASYSYATNVVKFDTDLGADAVDVHWDGALRAYGLRKSVIEDERYHMANFGLMSGTAMTNLEQAKQFAANSKRPGTDLATDGNLGRVKDVPNFKMFSPGLWMGDQRTIIGERGVTRFRMMKPWAMYEMEEQRDANGRFTGKKEAYGDQYVVLHTPTPLKRALTSIVYYSSSARVAA